MDQPGGHLDAVAAGRNGISKVPLWGKVQAMEDVRPVSVKRHLLRRTLTPTPDT